MEKINKKIDITITDQAERILAESRYGKEQFLQWSLKKGVSFGGNDVALFLEEMHKEKEKAREKQGDKE